jgi:hypothetical protein
MTADELINVLEQQGLLPPDAIVTLRQFVERSLKIVTPESLAKLLIDKRWLSPAQAKKLLKETPVKAAAPVVDEFDLAPLDEVPVKRVGLPPKKASDASETAVAVGAAAAKRSAAASSQPGDNVKSPPPAPAKVPPPATNGSSPPIEPHPTDDLFSEADLADALGGLQAGPLAPSARRRTIVPTWVWVVMAGSGALLVAVAALLILLLRSNGDSEWQLAEKDYAAGADRQAIAKLDAFLEEFPNHPRASTAIVYRGVSRLRLACAAKSNWEKALAIANEELPRIVSQPDFPSVRESVAKLLPEMAAGLAAQAKDAAKGSLARRRQQVEAALAGLAMAKDPRYTPDLQKPWALLQTLEDELALLARAVDRETELGKAVGEIRSALAAQQLTAATARRDRLLEEFPELLPDITVEALNQELAQAETAGHKTDSAVRPADPTTKPKSAVTIESPDKTHQAR